MIWMKGSVSIALLSFRFSVGLSQAYLIMKQTSIKYSRIQEI